MTVEIPPCLAFRMILYLLLFFIRYFCCGVGTNFITRPVLSGTYAKVSIHNKGSCMIRFNFSTSVNFIHFLSYQFFNSRDFPTKKALSGVNHLKPKGYISKISYIPISKSSSSVESVPLSRLTPDKIFISSLCPLSSKNPLENSKTALNACTLPSFASWIYR